MSKVDRLEIDFAEEKEAGYQRVYDRAPQLTSLAAQWSGILFAYDFMPPGETPEILAKQHCVGILYDLAESAWTDRTIDGQYRHEQVNDGDMLIVPADVPCRSRWNVTGSVIAIAIEPSIFAQTAYEAIHPDRVELLPRFATSDPLIHQMGRSLKTVLEQYGVASRLYGDTMATALMVHLLQNYSARRPLLKHYESGLSKHQLSQVIDYIYAHLDQDLSLSELAAIAQMSSHYFSQLFKQSMRITPHQYVIRVRVERAKELLTQGNLSIAEVAKIVGFVDQSHLHRHFKRLLSITPKMLRQISQ
jgi:AraC family transcriptional regulator